MLLPAVDVPEWVLAGLLLGVAVSGVIAGVFALGAYLFPSRSSGETIQSGETRRRTEIRQYLRAIDEPFIEDHAVENHTVAFYLPHRDIAITFDARVFYALKRTATHAILVEHEMPGLYIGRRLPFETPDMTVETAEKQSMDRSTAALAVLGLPANATEQQIKAAYREKVKTVHPDMGGDPEAFQRVQDAYAVVSDGTE